MSEPMERAIVGIDAHAAEGRLAGLGVYVRHWVKALKAAGPQSAFDLRFYSRKNSEQDLNTPARLGWENFELPRLAGRDRVKILHVPAFAPPLLKKFRLVVTVHDLIGMIFPNQLGAVSAFYWGKWLPFAVRNADCIVAVSDHTRKDLVSRLRIPEQKIRVIHSGTPENFTAGISQEKISSLKAHLGIRNSYFLFVGTLEPRKNLKRTIEAFRSFLKEVPEPDRFQMVIVGSQDFAHGRFFKELSAKLSFERPDQVLFTGYIQQEELNALYAGATAFLFPSLYEGFGFPVLEAMASGTPVLTSKTTSIPEVAGDAALLVDPSSEREICEGMKRLAGDQAFCRDLIQKGILQTRRFSWQKTAEQTLDVYRSLL